MKDNKIFTVIVALICVTPVILQIPVIHEKYNWINYIVWPLFAVYLILKNKGKIYYTSFLNVYSLIWIVLLLICFSIYTIKGTHLNSNILRILILPLGCYFIGNQLNEKISKENLLLISRIYSFSALFLAVWVQINNFSSLTVWQSSLEYFYAQKNSCAQILASAILINLFTLKYYSKIGKATSILISLYMFIVICLIQCRTVIISLILVGIFYILKKSSHKIMWIAIAIALGVIIFSIDSTRGFFEHTFLLDKYNGESLNSFSSGRLDYYKESLKIFNANIFIGNGKWYVDNFFLEVITELGLVLGLPIVCIYIYRIYLNFIHYRKNSNNTIILLVLSMSVFYIFESFMEAYPPFGPRKLLLCFLDIMWNY